MNRRTLARLALVASIAPSVGCGDSNATSDTDAGSCVAALRGGELVITEYMPDPKGSDADGIEWIEVHNPGSAPVSLVGVGLVYSKADGTDSKGHLIQDSVEVPPGAYMTFGAVTDETRPEYIDYGYGTDLGSMSNTSGMLTVRCGNVVVDEVLYDATRIKDGVSTTLDGQVTPDATANDDLATWCTAPTDGEPYFTTEYGSPRQPNAACPLAAPESCGQCYDGGVLRDAVGPQAGQLVISEVMANAGLTTMTVGEWFELQVTGGEFDLNCLQYGNNTTKFASDPESAQVLQQPECFKVGTGDTVLFSQKQWAETDVVMKLTLSDSPSDSNPSPGVFIAYGGQILDELHYPKPKDGVAWSLDPGATTVAGNDDPANLCLAYEAFAEGDLGTPGVANPVCLKNPCDDGGTVREALAPVPGDIFITEVHANASTGIGEPGGEWIEFFTPVSFDLNGLQLGKSAESISFTFPGEQCLQVGPGLVLLARSGATGDMLSPAATYSSLQLANSAGTLWLGVGGVELDHMPYDTPKDGVARQVDPAVIDAFTQSLDPTLNDPAEARCDAAVPYAPFNTDLGTPGADNSVCDGPPPTGQCTDPDTQTARDIDPPQAGELLITEWMANPKLVGDTEGEWFELLADADFDLNGLELGKVWDPYTVGDFVPVAGDCLEVKAGDSVLIARSADAAVNGGLPAPRFVTKLSLGNSNGGLFVGHGGVELDHVAYATTSDGASTQLSLAAITPGALDVAVNDDPANFCTAAALYNASDKGSPGAQNVACGGGFVDPCFDADLGAMREKHSPGAGDLVITEFLANPSGTETDREWFEVLVNADVDLNNVKALSKFAPTPTELTNAKAFGGTDCIAVAAGSRALVARKTDPAVNGGLPAVDAAFGFSLANSAGAISLAVGDLVLDAVQWATSQGEDIATQLDPGVSNPALNDNTDAAPWCDAVGPGTPKQENPACP
ncbi:lamin tail domain-containing protein [Nannocystis sp. RBIL2]|uniref:lamin tail domain-containing protein n=2 Tax=unclassified Nannocystis TaxID=2627009 RepID=UPI002270A946|nr:lamin tail domain-containing protein [Nannocystis sp. RBIL2]MCY1069849.1 lamin tail domain-containing protein [Nannocystis sp. RBIL2]